MAMNKKLIKMAQERVRLVLETGNSVSNLNPTKAKLYAPLVGFCTPLSRKA